MPYPGWAAFRGKIIQAVSLLIDSRLATSVERYSLKYVDVIEADPAGEQIKKINIDLRIGSHTVSNENFSIRVEMLEGDTATIIQLAASIQVLLDGKKSKEGILIDVDIIHNKPSTMDLFDLNNMEINLKYMHNESKKYFFECLTAETIELLGPIYAS